MDGAALAVQETGLRQHMRAGTEATHGHAAVIGLAQPGIDSQLQRGKQFAYVCRAAAGY